MKVVIEFNLLLTSGVVNKKMINEKGSYDIKYFSYGNNIF